MNYFLKKKKEEKGTLIPKVNKKGQNSPHFIVPAEGSKHFGRCSDLPQQRQYGDRR